MIWSYPWLFVLPTFVYTDSLKQKLICNRPFHSFYMLTAGNLETLDIPKRKPKFPTSAKHIHGFLLIIILKWTYYLVTFNHFKSQVLINEDENSIHLFLISIYSKVTDQMLSHETSSAPPLPLKKKKNSLKLLLTPVSWHLVLRRRKRSGSFVAVVFCTWGLCAALHWEACLA